MGTVSRGSALVVVVLATALVGLATAHADEPAFAIPAEIYLPDASVITLVEPPSPDLLARRIQEVERAQDVGADDPAVTALTTFSLERLAWVRDSLAAEASGSAWPQPEHDGSRALLRQLELDALDAATATEVRLARGVLGASGPPSDEVIEALGLVLTALATDDAERRAVAALLLSDALRDDGELPDAEAALDAVGDGTRHELLALWKRARLAEQRRQTTRVEKLLYQLVRAISDDVVAYQRIDPALLDRIVLELARAGAGREDGWVRTRQALDWLPSDVGARLVDRLVAAYDDGGVTMNRARVRLYAVEELGDDEVGSRLETVVAAAEELGDQHGSQLCLEALTLATGEPAADLATRCLDVYLTVPHDAAHADFVLTLYDPIADRFPQRLRPLDRARYGMALLETHQTGFAREQILQVDIAALPEAERASFAAAAVELRYTTNADIRLEELSCTLRRSQPLPVEDVRYLAWIEVAREQATTEADRYALGEKELAVYLMNGQYEEGRAKLTSLLELVGRDSPQEPALELAVGHTLGCLDEADRWTELAELTPSLRRSLGNDVRERVFDAWGPVINQAHLDLANALDLAGKTEDAVTLLLDLQSAWRSNPGVAELLFATGALLAANGQAHRAMTYYEQIFEEHATDPLADDALFAAAMALRADGDAIQARALLERITREHTTGEYPQRALEILEQMPDEPAPAPP